jgi:hypothetical protein
VFCVGWWIGVRRRRRRAGKSGEVKSICNRRNERGKRERGRGACSERMREAGVVLVFSRVCDGRELLILDPSFPAYFFF